MKITILTDNPSSWIIPFIEELIKADLYKTVSQAFAVFLPIKSVGVVGDARRYEYVIALRAAETIDFMTARAAKLDHDFLNLVLTFDDLTICI